MKVLVYSDYGSGCPDAIKEFNVKGFPENSNGKVRTSKVKVLRKVPIEKCGVYGKILANNKK